MKSNPKNPKYHKRNPLTDVEELQKILDKEPELYNLTLSAFKPDPYEPERATLFDFFDNQLQFFTMYDSIIEFIKENPSSNLVALQKFVDLDLDQGQMEEFSYHLLLFFCFSEKYKKHWPKHCKSVMEIRDYATTPEYDPFNNRRKEEFNSTAIERNGIQQFTKREIIALMEGLMFNQPTFSKATNAAKARFLSKLTNLSQEKLEQELSYYNSNNKGQFDSLVQDWRDQLTQKPDGRKKN